MIMKILLLLVVLAAVYFIFFKKKTPQTQNMSKEKKRNVDEEIMIECSKCGTYVSSKEAVIKDGRFFCSKECAGVG
ncbi:PP0621 family protein [Nitrosophilus alvini]|uniref:PP0621 family protein n=1 Tax=Nitrosophilus alvini TaxID=2714855 RepID=UPI00190C53C1|nr:PP0621 family protein [Nitrosophilus alvini]